MKTSILSIGHLVFWAKLVSKTFILIANVVLFCLGVLVSSHNIVRLITVKDNLLVFVARLFDSTDAL